MMTIGSDSLSPCHSKSVTCWILLILALCLPGCGQAVEGRQAISSRTGNFSTILSDSRVKHPSTTASSTRAYRERRDRRKTQYTAPAASSSTQTYRDKRDRTQHTPSTVSSSRQQSSLPPPVVGAGLTKGSAYAVGPEDVLAIEVFDNPELKGEYIVSTGGDIVFPLIGQVHVANKTLATIKKKLTRLLEKDYLYNPIVSVDVSKYLSKQVKIMGNVHQPGVYYLEGPTRLFDLLTRAGGILKKPGGTVMSGQKVHITRADLKSGRLATSTGHTKTYYVDLYQLLVEARDETNVYLQSGDVIFIPSASSFHVIGEVKKPGSFPFEEGITLFQALSLAGGLTKKGDADAIVIKRMRDGKGVEMKANMQTLIAPNDSVFVPGDKKFIHVVGEVKNADSFLYERGITLLNAVNYAGGTTQQGLLEDAIIKRLSNGKTIEMKGGADTVLRPNDTVVIPKARSIEVVGEVKQPGSLPYKSGMTLLKAIAMAGGATKKGDLDDSIIKRLVNGKIKEIEATPTTLVLPDDVIEVPLSFW